MWSDHDIEHSSEEEIILSDTTSSSGSEYLTDTDSDIISEEDDINDDMDFNINDNDELVNGYYIGVVDNLTLINYVTPSVFYNYPFERVSNYLTNWSIVSLSNRNIEIMLLEKTLCNINGSLFTIYSVTIKTHYIKIVQNAWKRVLKYRKELNNKRRRYNSLRYREIHGKWPQGLNQYPSLKGCINYPKVLDMEILYRY